jgi:phage-related protein
MPESVANAAPVTVLPSSLSSAFVHTREYPVIDNEYRNGESQRSAQAATSHKKWNLTKRLTATQLAALRTFYDARNGTHEPFYFYDPYETNPKFSYDPTGAAVTGRYTVRFNTDWSQSVTLGRSDVQLELIELAWEKPMPGKSQSHTDAVLNLLRGTDLAGVAPYVGLFSVAPADDNSAGTELAGNGYARQAITFGAPVTDAGNVRRVSNTSSITFGPALAGWSQAMAFGVFASVAFVNSIWPTSILHLAHPVSQRSLWRRPERSPAPRFLRRDQGGAQAGVREIRPLK